MAHDTVYDLFIIGGALDGTGIARDARAHGATKRARDVPFLPDTWAASLIRACGTEACEVPGNAGTAADPGRDFGATLTGVEPRRMMGHACAQTGGDALWRRTKPGPRLSEGERSAVDDWIKEQAA